MQDLAATLDAMWTLAPFIAMLIVPPVLASLIGIWVVGK